MIITAILQVRNEESSGHLSRFLRWNKEIFDNLVVFDDCSDDESVRLLNLFGASVILGEFHSFNSELNIKDLLLMKALEEFPETDWVLWLDADELLLESRSKIEEFLLEAERSGFEGVSLPLVNLWKSEFKFRFDSGFNELENVRFWKNTGRLHFVSKPGLHHVMHPNGMNRVLNFQNLRVLHFGFASHKHIVNKFLTYQESGQRGRNLWRLVDENNLELKAIEFYSEQLGDRFADWYESIDKDNCEIQSPKLIDSCTYSQNHSREKYVPKVTLISLIYAGVDWLEFQYGELIKLQKELGKGEVEILFVANDASDEVLTFLKENSIPFVVAPGRSNKDEWYINSVYRGYNYGASHARGDFVLLTNSDMAYMPGFLYQMIKNKNQKTYLVGKLIESGRLTPASYAVKRNLGKRLNNFKRGKFYKIARKISVGNLTSGGLYMPLLIHRESFLMFGGYPEGNVKKEALEGYVNSGETKIAIPGEDLYSGDYAFVKRLEANGWDFKTVNNAVLYHFQEGEKSEHSATLASLPKSGFSFESKPDARLIVSSLIPNKTTRGGVILITDDYHYVSSLEVEQINQIQACITSNKLVLHNLAVLNDIHTYYISSLTTTPQGNDPSIMSEILENELKYSFLPQEPKSMRAVFVSFLPTRVREFIRVLIK